MDIVEKKINIPNQLRHPWETARLNIIKHYLHHQLCTKFKNQGGVVLDIGCGDIFVAQSLATIYPKVQFICIDIAFTQTMIETMKAQIYTSNIYLFSSIHEAKSMMHIPKVDVVLLLDVIEHIENDISFLKHLKTQNADLLNEAYWFITVPAFQKLFCQHDVFLGHYRRYTNAMLKRHLKLAGFRVFVLNYFFISLLFPRILKVIAEKIFSNKNPEKGIGQWTKPVCITWFIHYFLLLDFYISLFLYKFKIRIPGLSNFCICKSVL